MKVDENCCLDENSATLNNDNDGYQNMHKETRKMEKRSIFSCIMLEPVLIGSSLAIQLAQTSFQNLYLETACMVDLAHPKNDCYYGNSEKSPFEMQSQTLLASVNITRSFLGSAITATVLLFISPWSDFSGRRKPAIILPLIGMCLTSLNVLLILTIPRLSVSWVIYAVQIPLSIGGSFTLLYTGVFNYLGDICYSNGEDATAIMGRHRAAMQASVVVGSLLGPLTYRSLGFFGVFGITFSMQVFALVFAWIFVKDLNVNKNNKVKIYDIRLPVSALQCVFKKRDDRKRMIILMMILVSSLDKLISSGDNSVSYMFMRNKFEWSDILFGIFLSYKNVLVFSGILFILNVLRKVFSTSNHTIGMLGGISQVSAMLLLMFSANTYIVFLSPIVGLLAQGIIIVQKPIINNQIKADEQGKISSITGALDATVQLAINPVYNVIYKHTVVVFPGAFLCVSIIAALIQSVSFITTRRLSEVRADNYPTKVLQNEDPVQNEESQ